MRSSGFTCRATALTTPNVTDPSRPSGLPSASDDLALPQGLRIAQGQEGEPGLDDLEEREIALLVDADDLRADGAAGRLDDGARRHGLGGGRESTTCTRRAPATTCALVTM